ncbi:MAG: fasciclin domain-containing protein [Dysgonamonadaceae bacterium]|jgi:uncharacterized surface protein with fasciclin (FAS1) repeats|nr:fasciclin domain-containing protein [Dysgonamonadaceae bacterium]
MKIKYITVFVAGLVSLSLYFSCTDDEVNNDAFYTFTGESVASFCEGNQNLSLFTRLIEESGYKSLLSLYGHFTCFAPTDSAFQAYFKANNITYEDLTDADKKAIVNDHVIKDVSREYISDEFQDGALPTPNMGGRYLVVSYSNSDSKQVIWINRSSPVVSKDNKLHNGVVHVVGNVIIFSQETLLAILKSNDNFKMFANAFELTGLNDSVSNLYDVSYNDPSPGRDFVNVVGYDNIKVIHAKKLGYTLFAETDKVFADAGITTINQLVEYAEKYYGTADRDNYASRENALNKFVSYHLLDRQMPSNELLYSGGNTAPSAINKRHEYYETMLKMRLMEIKAPDVGSSAGNQINTTRSGKFVGIDYSLTDIEAFNGYIHALTDILVYDENVMRQDVLHKRIRLDAYAIPSALTNNNIRWKNVGQSFTITPELCGESFTFNPACKIILWASLGWDDYQGDEISIRGWYDFTLRLPPVPPGTWELRLGYSAVWWRGIAQLFIDGQIQGIPVDLSLNGESPQIGWIADDQSVDNGVENDKMMRNRGYMKSGADIINESYKHILRNGKNDIRIIVGKFDFQDYDYHYFRAKNVEREDGEFHLDFIELVPVSFLDDEDRG